MKRTLLVAALAFAAPAAFAAEAATKTTTAAPAVSVDQASAAAKADAARAELAELRTQMQELSRKMASLSAELGDVGPRAYAFRYLGQPDRAMIGVVLASDPHGVRISAVTPDGPAARAGLHDGDVIVAINGQKLAGTAPSQSLITARKLLGDIREDQEVRIAWQRGAKAQGDVLLKAQRREAWNWPELMNEDPEHPFLPKDFNERVSADVERALSDANRALLDKDRMHAEIERATRIAGQVHTQDIRNTIETAHRAARQAMPWWGLNLAPVNADLGHYFGVDKGALVISADADSLPGLRAGDVITGVAGETVSRPEDALRALRDQPAGKEVPIRLLRERKTVVLDVKAPQFKSIFSMPPLPPTPPAPPVPPGAPPAPHVLPAAPPAPPTPPAPPLPPPEHD